MKLTEAEERDVCTSSTSHYRAKLFTSDERSLKMLRNYSSGDFYTDEQLDEQVHVRETLFVENALATSVKCSDQPNWD